MTEKDFLELISMNLDRLPMVSMNIAGVFFAYVVCAYFAGKHLNKVYAVTVSLIYSGFVLGGVLFLAVTLNVIIFYRISYVEAGAWIITDNAYGMSLFCFFSGQRLAPATRVWAFKPFL